MVAAAGQIEGMKPNLAIICLAACVLGMVACLLLIVRTDALGKLPLELSPEVLAQKAHDVVAQLGYDPRAVDKATDFDYDEDFQRWAEKNDKPRADWSKISRKIRRFFASRIARARVTSCPLIFDGRTHPGS